MIYQGISLFKPTDLSSAVAYEQNFHHNKCPRFHGNIVARTVAGCKQRKSQSLLGCYLPAPINWDLWDSAQRLGGCDFLVFVQESHQRKRLVGGVVAAAFRYCFLNPQ